MKLVHVETGKHLYGGARQVLYLLEGLQDRGHESILVCTEGSAIAERASARGLRVEPMACTGEVDLEFMLRLRHLLRQEKPDLVHLHSRRGADSLGLLAARWAGVPAVLSRRVDNPEPPWLAKLRYGMCDQVITISEAIRQVLVETGVTEEKITCVRSAVEPGRFEPRLDRGEFLDEMQLEKGDKVVAVIAQLIERKNHIGLLRALAKVEAELAPEWKFLFLGQGPLQEKLQIAVENLGLGHRVRLAGFRSDLPDFLGHIDILVHPALMEGLGVSLIEAAAAGVPIIGNPAGGIPEIVHHQENGLLVDCTDPEALGEALQQLCASESTRERLGHSGQQLVAREFSVDKMVEGNLAVYAKLMNNRKT